jgi:hypothetical protein
MLLIVSGLECCRKRPFVRVSHVQSATEQFHDYCAVVIAVSLLRSISAKEPRPHDGGCTFTSTGADRWAVCSAWAMNNFLSVFFVLSWLVFCTFCWRFGAAAFKRAAAYPPMTMCGCGLLDEDVLEVAVEDESEVPEFFFPSSSCSGTFSTSNFSEMSR